MLWGYKGLHQFLEEVRKVEMRANQPNHLWVAKIFHQPLKIKRMNKMHAVDEPTSKEKLRIQLRLPELEFWIENDVSGRKKIVPFYGNLHLKSHAFIFFLIVFLTLRATKIWRVKEMQIGQVCIRQLNLSILACTVKGQNTPWGKGTGSQKSRQKCV